MNVKERLEAHRVQATADQGQMMEAVVETMMKAIRQNIEHGRLSFFDAYPLSPEDVVLLGDSIVAGGEWAEIAPGARIRNRGIGGDQSGDLLKRLGPIAKGRPCKLFVLIGTNDLGAGVAPDRILHNLESIVDRVRDATPQTRVYLHELFPRDATYAKRIRSLNTEIRRIAEARSLPVVRVFDRFADETGAVRPDLTYDDLHLSGQGYRHWYTLLEPHLHADASASPKERSARAA